jgi:hypothetical protein
MITQIGFDPWIYDTDGDCYISAAEKDQAIADWQSGKITMSNVLAVVSLWKMGTKNPACGVPPPPTEANLHGLVHDRGGNPLPAVSVSLNGLSTATMLDGTFGFTNIEPGKYTVACTKSGYQDVSKSITLSAGDNGLDITMLAEGEKVGIWEWIKEHWKWIAGGAGVAAAIGAGIALAKKRK